MIRTLSHTYRRAQDSRLLPFIVLPAILAVHLLLFLRLHPTHLFGLQQDDALYFSSAKALAEGRGFILPSLPSAPAANMYPILYPWILSWVWRANPNFPANLSLAIALNYVFALAAILLSYFFCRIPLRLGRIESLAITAFCALHPTFVFYSARLMTDVPFAAFTMAFLLVSSKAVETGSSPQSSTTRESPLLWPMLAGLLANLCVLMRLNGIAFVAGLLLALILRKRWRSSFTFLASSSPAIFYFLYQGFFRTPSPPPVPFSASLPGWQQTWYRFTSYTSFRHLDSPDFHSAVTLLLNQVLYFLSTVSGYFVSPLSDSSLALWLVSCLALASLLFVGILRSIKTLQPAPEVASLLAYLVLLAGWDYVEWQRFLLPFVPLLVFLICSEGWRSFLTLRTSGRDWLSRSLLAVCLLFAMSLGAATTWNYTVSSRKSLGELTGYRERALPERQAAFAWIRTHTEPTDVVITTEYGTTYLYTGRQAINFTVPLPYGVYDRNRLHQDLDHITDVAQALQARYWVIADSDSQTQLSAFEQPLRERLSRLETSLPRIFTSPGGTIRVYDLHCHSLSSAGTCPTVP